MNELDWRRLENRLVEAHRAADPPLSPAVWRGVAAARVVRRPRRRLWLAMGASVLAAAAGVALWCLPVPPVPPAPPALQLAPPVRPVPPPPPVAPSTVPMRNAVLETRGAVTFALSVDAGRIELEPCRGRFVNVTLLDSPHHQIELHQRGRRVEVVLDGGGVMRGGVAHILVPADTHLVLSTRRGDVVVRGLGGPMEIDTVSGEVQIDTAPRRVPTVTVTSESGAITWRGHCDRGCLVDTRSQSGDITLRASDATAFIRGAVRGETQTGRLHIEELTCTDPQCSSSPLPWRQPAAGPHP